MATTDSESRKTDLNKKEKPQNNISILKSQIDAIISRLHEL